MANILSTQILVDGERNAVVKITGILDTSNVSTTTVVDPASFTPVPTTFRVDAVEYSVGTPLAVRLVWDASTDVDMLALTNAGRMKFTKFGGLQNNSGAGVTGKIQLLTNGYSSGTVTFSIVLKLVKI
jgi:hypothetical protein